MKKECIHGWLHGNPYKVDYDTGSVWYVYKFCIDCLSGEEIKLKDTTENERLTEKINKPIM